MRFYYNKRNGFANEHGQVAHSTPGGFSTLAHIDHCQCDDGKRRAVRITGYADSFFSTPAECTVKGKTVSGFVTTDNGEYLFHATGKNRELIETHKCQCASRCCGCVTSTYGRSRAIVSLLTNKKALCRYCAGFETHKPLLTDKTCEDEQVESDAYYGAMRGMTGVEYTAFMTAQYQTTEDNDHADTN